MCRSQTDFFCFWHTFPLFYHFSDFAHFAFLAVFYPHIFGKHGRFSLFSYCITKHENRQPHPRSPA